jgi:hypothetical protein
MSRYPRHQTFLGTVTVAATNEMDEEQKKQLKIANELEQEPGN